MMRMRPFFTFVSFFLVSCASTLFASVTVDMPEGNQPSAMSAATSESKSDMQVIYVDADLSEKEIITTSSQSHTDFAVVAGKEDTAKKEEEEPALEPLVLAGTGAAVAGAGVVAAGVFGAPILLGIGALLLIASAVLTTIGWKKIKSEPKKYRGEKFAIASFLIIGVIGVAASFYALYLLFAV